LIITLKQQHQLLKTLDSSRYKQFMKPYALCNAIMTIL
jgi:hypothetical protein